MFTIHSWKESNDCNYDQHIFQIHLGVLETELADNFVGDINL